MLPADVMGFTSFTPSYELLIYEEVRHYMAHGFMRLEVGRAGSHRFQLIRRGMMENTS